MRGALFAVTFLVLAGCSQATPESGDGAGLPAGTPMLSGVVVDPGIVPLAGVQLRVLETNATATTDANGHYSFPELPVDRILIVVANKAGFKVGSKQVSIPSDATVLLNFSLEPVPVKTPFKVTDQFQGFLACQVTTEVSEQNQTYACDAGNTVDQWEFAVSPDLAGAVIEVFWTAQTPLASALHGRLETLNLGLLNVVLAEDISTSPLRLVVGQAAAEKYYSGGGIMKLTVRVDPNNDAGETALGAGVAFEQGFDAYYGLFYVAPPPTDYTIADA